MRQKPISSDSLLPALAKLLEMREPASKVTKLTIVLEAGKEVRYSMDCIGKTNECEPPYTKHIDPMELETQKAIRESRWRDEKNV